MILQNYAWIKDPFEEQDRPMDFKYRGQKFIDVFLESKLQL